MSTKKDADVPSPIDLRSMVDARKWAEEVTIKRPWREDFFRCFLKELRPFSARGNSILELGSGPGFLAQKILNQLSFSRYTALDFSDAMHALARERLEDLSDRVEFITRDFLTPDWANDLARYDIIVSLQAVHELRHKRRVPVLYNSIINKLSHNGVFLICDHFTDNNDGKNTSLFMNLIEHEDALKASGFTNVKCLLNKGGMVFYRATQKTAEK